MEENIDLRNDDVVVMVRSGTFGGAHRMVSDLLSGDFRGYRAVSDVTMAGMAEKTVDSFYLRAAERDRLIERLRARMVSTDWKSDPDGLVSICSALADVLSGGVACGGCFYRGQGRSWLEVPGDDEVDDHFIVVLRPFGR